MQTKNSKLPKRKNSKKHKAQVLVTICPGASVRYNKIMAVAIVNLVQHAPNQLRISVPKAAIRE